jgi:putative hydrolase of the HAD superfamily
MRFQTLFFDLDDTLYPSRTGLWNAIRDRMGLYMHERLHIPWEDIPHLRIHYLETYGTTLRGLQHFHSVDTEEYLAFVHDLPLDRYLYPEPENRSLLLSLPQPKWIFTNADDAHARRVLAVLNLVDCFQGIIDLHALGFFCKPEKETYLRALKIAGTDNPSRCVILDDSVRNLVPARELGFTTVLVHNHTSNLIPSQDHTVDYVIDHPRALREILPELWELEVHP